MDNEPRLAFVFVVGRKAQDLSINVKATFKAASYARVSVLEPADAEKLILTAQRDQTLVFTDEAVERVLGLTAGHPFFTQLLCQIVWELAHKNKPEPTPLVGSADIDAAAPRVLASGENYFQWIWDGLPPAERVIMATIASVTDNRNSVTKEHLLDILQEHGVRILSKELDIAPDTLVEWEMLRQSGGEYSFFIELVRRWIVAQKPLPKVKDELYRINTPAENLYQGGSSLYRAGDLPNGMDLLRRAITMNPTHLKARLLLAQVLTESGDLRASLQELETAFTYDEAEVRGQLIRTLLLLGESLIQTDSAAALSTYDRVLEITPSQKTAVQQIASIWLKRGTALLASGNLESALDAFRKADATDRIREIESQLKRRRIEESAARAQEFENHEAWEDAVQAYGLLVTDEPDDERWKSSLARAEFSLNLERSYNDGRAAEAAKQFQRAMRALADVIYARPDYKNAAEMLAGVVRDYRIQVAPIPETRQADSEKTSGLVALGSISKPVEVESAASSSSSDGVSSPVRERETRHARKKERRQNPEAEEKMLMPPARRKAALPTPGDREITISKEVTVRELSEKLGIQTSLVISKLVDRGIFATINQTIDAKAATAIAREFGASTVNCEEEGTWHMVTAKIDPGIVREISSPMRTLAQTVPITGAFFHPEGESIAVLPKGAGIQLLDVYGGSSLGTLKQGDVVASLAYNGTGELIAEGDETGHVKIWAVSKERMLVHRMLIPKMAPVAALAFSGDSALVLAGSSSGTVALMRVSDGRSEVVVSQVPPITSVAFGLGRSLAVGTKTGLAMVYEFTLASGPKRPGRLDELHILEHPGTVTCLSFHPKQDVLATGCEDGFVRLNRGGILGPQLPHDGSVLLAEFSLDGRRLATASTDGNAHVWDVQTGHELLRVYCESEIVSASFNKTTNRLATASPEKVDVWDVGV